MHLKSLGDCYKNGHQLAITVILHIQDINENSITKKKHKKINKINYVSINKLDSVASTYLISCRQLTAYSLTYWSGQLKSSSSKASRGLILGQICNNACNYRKDHNKRDRERNVTTKRMGSGNSPVCTCLFTYLCHIIMFTPFDRQQQFREGLWEVLSTVIAQSPYQILFIFTEL